MILETINWNEMWKKERDSKQISFSIPEEEYRWDQIAPLFRQWMEIDDYPNKLLQRIHIRPEWSVLDIGCGTGTISIETASRARSVTALDISRRMLDILKLDAEQKHLKNISYLHSSWEDVRSGIDIQPHDIVITSRMIARTGDLKESLTKINQMAMRYAYVTAWGGNQRSLNLGLRKALGYEYKDTADYIYVINILHQMGIRPNVEQIVCQSKIIYPTLEDAINNFTVLFSLSSENIPIVRSYLQANLIQMDDGRYLVPDSRPVWSLIWWKKE